MALAVLVALGGRVWAAPESRPASSDSTAREKAREKLRDGARLFEAGDYLGALTLFQQAHAIFSSPQIFYNIAVAYDKLERWGPAFMSFERFLRQPGDAPTKQVLHARQRLESLLPMVAFVSLSCDVADAEVILDGTPVARTPIPFRLAVDTGPHELIVRSETIGSAVRRFTVVARQVIDVTVELRPSNALPAAESPPRPLPPAVKPVNTVGLNSPSTLPSSDLQGSRSWLVPARWAAVAGAAGSLALGVGFNVRANAIRDEFVNFVPSGSATRCSFDGETVLGGPRCEELASSHEQSKTIAILGYVSGGAFAVTAIVLFMMGREGKPQKGVLPGTSAGAFGATFFGRF